MYIFFLTANLKIPFILETSIKLMNSEPRGKSIDLTLICLSTFQKGSKQQLMNMFKVLNFNPNNPKICGAIYIDRYRYKYRYRFRSSFTEAIPNGGNHKYD